MYLWCKNEEPLRKTNRLRIPSKEGVYMYLQSKNEELLRKTKNR